MWVVALTLALSPLGAEGAVHPGPERASGADPLATLVATSAYAPRPPRPSDISKKAAWLQEKSSRPDVRVPQSQIEQAARVRFAPKLPQTAPFPEALPPPGSRIEPITTLFSVRLKEAVAVLPGRSMHSEFQSLLRDHYTNQSTDVDLALLGAVTRAALKFSAPRVEVVSGYRSPKYNLSLRKKGRQVAASSQHCEGRAVDFRLRGVPTRELWKFVRGLNMGGVGFYPHSRFVHCDTGPVRFWNGE